MRDYSNDAERFWAKVDKNGPIPEHCPELGPCWIWTGQINGNGYGVARINKRAVLAHRAAWILAGDPPDEWRILHHCDNPPCIRQSHTYKGTLRDNTADAIARDRLPRGDRHPSSKLTEAQVVELREIYATGEWSQGQLARRFNVGQATICRAIRGDAWAHAPGNKGPADKAKALKLRGERERGENHPGAKLTEAQVREIRALSADGIRYRAIATKFQAEYGTVWAIVHRKIWKHVP